MTWNGNSYLNFVLYKYLRKKKKLKIALQGKLYGRTENCSTHVSQVL